MSINVGYPAGLAQPFGWDELRRNPDRRLETFDDIVELLQRVSDAPAPTAIIMQINGELSPMAMLVRVIQRHSTVPIHVVHSEMDHSRVLASLPGVSSVHDVRAGYDALCKSLDRTGVGRTGTHQRREINLNELSVDIGRRKVSVSGREVVLTRKEFDVLRLLASSCNLIVPRQRVIDIVWGEGWVGAANALDTHIGHLRAKLAKAGATSSIVTVRGVGFYLDTPAATDSDPHEADHFV